jgi:tellurite methyltransferase
MTEDKSAGWAAYYEKLRERPPRRTLITALDRFGPAAAGSLAVDLGCGDGRDVVEMLRRGWRVVAVDAEPEALKQLQERIRDALPSGGRFSGQWYGPRDSWFGRAGMTFVSRDEAITLLAGLDIEMFEEEEADGVTPRGNAKHWHIFHVVARRQGA